MQHFGHQAACFQNKVIMVSYVIMVRLCPVMNFYKSKAHTFAQ